MKKISLFCLAIFAAAAANAAAAKPYYVDGSVDYRAVVTAPPPEDSIAGRADRELAILFDTNRSPEQTALAQHFAKFSAFTLLADVMGERCTRETLPRTAAFLDRVYAETRPVILGAKETWNRRRPYDYNPDLRPVVDRPPTTSYPSGHSFAASVCAVLMSAAFPERAAEWAKEARLVRWSRLYGGAHYPHDVIAGQLLGEAVAQAMLRSPELQEALREVRAEILALTAAKAA